MSGYKDYGDYQGKAKEVGFLVATFSPRNWVGTVLAGLARQYYMNLHAWEMNIESFNLVLDRILAYNQVADNKVLMKIPLTRKLVDRFKQLYGSGMLPVITYKMEGVYKEDRGKKFLVKKKNAVKIRVRGQPTFQSVITLKSIMRGYEDQIEKGELVKVNFWDIMGITQRLYFCPFRRCGYSKKYSDINDENKEEKEKIKKFINNCPECELGGEYYKDKQVTKVDTSYLLSLQNQIKNDIIQISEYIMAEVLRGFPGTVEKLGSKLVGEDFSSYGYLTEPEYQFVLGINEEIEKEGRINILKAMEKLREDKRNENTEDIDDDEQKDDVEDNEKKEEDLGEKE
jgi:hypothetical protein